MSNFSIFTDVSLDPVKKVGVGAWLIVEDNLLSERTADIKSELLNNLIKYKSFTDTSSTALEVQIVLYVLKQLPKNIKYNNLTIYTDSQCISGLLRRRERLESNNYCSKKKKQIIRNAFLYQEFYKLYDELQFNIIKVTGHTKSINQDTIHRIFSIVDQAARKKFRLDNFLLK